jgi:hypothetical protein
MVHAEFKEIYHGSHIDDVLLAIHVDAIRDQNIRDWLKIDKHTLTFYMSVSDIPIFASMTRSPQSNLHNEDFVDYVINPLRNYLQNSDNEKNRAVVVQILKKHDAEYVA